MASLREAYANMSETPKIPTQDGGKHRRGHKDLRTKAELYKCAKKEGIEGRSTMNKAALKRALDKKK